jgi:AraC-like DNA-binding protein
MNENVYADEDKNSLRISEFDHYIGQTTFNNVAAKFVVKGKETYYVKNRKFELNKGEYIIGNNNHLSEINISENTVGVCIDVSNTIINEVLNTVFDNPDLGEFILTDKFLINKYNAKNTSLGHKLSDLSNNLLLGQREQLLNDELFYSLGETIVMDQAVVFEQLSRLNFKKQQVTEEVYRNLQLAKNYLDDCFLEPINLDSLTQLARISKYAFIRQFKTAFGITPYNYLIIKRLEYAKTLLLNKELVLDVALKVGFADTPSFSKSFKSYFGISPSLIK